MASIVKRRFTMQVTAILLALALNLGAIDGITRFILQEWLPGSFTNSALVVQTAEAGQAKTVKKQNQLPPAPKPKPSKNALALESVANKEVVAKRTLKSKTFQLGENIFKTVVYENPIHYMNSQNKLADIDNTLVRASGNESGYTNLANSLKVRFTASTSRYELGALQLQGHSLGWAPTVDYSNGKVSQNRITYPLVAEDTDLSYTVNGMSVNGEISLNGSKAPTEFQMALRTRNLQTQAGSDGSLSFSDPKTGQVIWDIPKPYMYDAKGARSEAVTMKSDRTSGKLILTITADDQWIKSTERQLPVVIALTTRPGPAAGRDTYGDTRGLFYFDTLPKDQNVTVTSATFSAYARAGNPKEIELCPVKSAWQWDDQNLTWDSLRSQGSLDVPVDTVSGPATGWWNFDVTGLVQQWINKPASNLGLALLPKDATEYKGFLYQDNGKLSPVLVYTYKTGGTTSRTTAYQLQIDRKTGLVKAEGTAAQGAPVQLSVDDGRTFDTTADSNGKWEIKDIPFEKGKIQTIKVGSASQKFLIAVYSKGARTSKLAKFYYKDGSQADRLKADNGVENELELVVGDYVLVLDPLRNQPYTTGPVVANPDADYRAREKNRPLYDYGELVGDSVDAATGNFVAGVTDLEINGRGIPFDFSRVLNSQEPEMYRGPLGINWQFAYTKLLIKYGDGSIEATGGDGGGYFFQPSGKGFKSDSDVTESLQKNADGSYSVVTRIRRNYHFNSEGVLDRITDANGNSLTLGYDVEGLLRVVTDAAGRTCNLYYDDQGRIKLLEDPQGRQLEYAYDDSGRLSRVTDAASGVTWYGYHGFRISTIIDPMSYVTLTNNYDSGGRVVKQIDAEGYTTNLSYSGNTTTVTDKNDNKFLYTFDEQYRTTAIAGPAVPIGLPQAGAAVSGTTDSGALRTIVEFHYDSNGYRDQIKDALGHSRYFKYDRQGNLLSVLNNHNKGVQYLYNDARNPFLPTEAIDPLGSISRREYDARGNNIRETNPLNQSIVYTYDDYGQLITETDPTGGQTTYTYFMDGNARSITESMTDSEAYETFYFYDNVSRVIEEVESESSIIFYEYDQNDNKIREYYWSNGKREEYIFRYNKNGDIIGRRAYEGGVTIYLYDQRGLLLKEVYPSLDSTNTEYDGMGNEVRVQDSESGEITESEYNALGWVTKVTETDSKERSVETTRYFFDAVGNTIGELDQDNKLTAYTYDDLNRMESVTDQAGRVSRVKYDEMGNIVYYQDFEYNHADITYDQFSRVIEVILNDSYIIRYKYDQDGNSEMILPDEDTPEDGQEGDEEFSWRDLRRAIN